jgi:hypothetical protein
MKSSNVVELLVLETTSLIVEEISVKEFNNWYNKISWMGMGESKTNQIYFR